MTVGLGILGCGSVFEAYARQIAILERSGRARVVAAFDPDPHRRDVARSLFPEALTDTSDPDAVIEHPDVDVVCVLTSMRQHAPLAIDALTAGKDVLLEKPMATTLADGARLLEAAEQSERLLVCAPHVVLSPTFRALHDRLQQNDIGRVLSARARYGWQGPGGLPGITRRAVARSSTSASTTSSASAACSGRYGTCLRWSAQRSSRDECWAPTCPSRSTTPPTSSWTSATSALPR